MSDHLLTETASRPQSYKASNFAPAFFFLSSDRRHALKILYAVCRALDDAVDNGHPDARGLLAAWKESVKTRQTAALEKYGHADLGREFFAVVERYKLPEFAFIDLIDKGVARDLEPARFQTPLDTEEYCYGVAGTVGIMCLPIFGVPWVEAKEYALRLGITVQWINTIRDVGADAKMNRIYLPLDHLEQFGYTEQDVFSMKNTPEFNALIRHEAKVARAHYARALELFPKKYHRELLPARVMGQIYMKLLDKIERLSFPVLSQKVTLNGFERIAAAWKGFYG
jgi:phytoene synthase